jgi:large subunit ribosomal protein L23
MNDIIIRPVITEKSIALASSGKYTFIVDKKADKITIKRVVEEAFNVKVLDVATLVVKGKTKRVGKRRTEEVVSALKKAVVRIEKGQKIDLFELAG